MVESNNEKNLPHGRKKLGGNVSYLLFKARDWYRG
jgi:hypothetical protein